MSPLSIDFLKLMVTGVITAEEMLLSSLGRILSAPGALSALSFPNIFVIIFSVICISDSFSPGYGKVVLHNGTLYKFSSVNTNEKYSLNLSAISLSPMGALLLLLFLLLLLSLLISGPGANLGLDFVLDLR